MRLIKIVTLTLPFWLCACSAPTLTNEESYRVGKEWRKTDICLRRSHVDDLRKLGAKEVPPQIGIFPKLFLLKSSKIMINVTGKVANFNLNYAEQGYNENIQHNFDCKPYLDFYESEYYKLKQQGY